MQNVSNNYKKDIRKTPFRNHSYMRVTVGVINQDAQRNALVKSRDSYLYLSDFSSFLNDYNADPYYATAEEDFSKADGSMYFAPPDKSLLALNQGVISKSILGGIRIDFDYPYDLRGITVEFGEYYPIDFDIVTENGVYEIRENSNGRFVYSEVIQNASYIEIIPYRMINGQGRLRILKFTAGIGIFFDNQKIISCTKNEYISPLSAEIPAIDLTLTVDNKDRQFDIENDLSSVNFLEVGQTVTAEYGYELDSGAQEWMKGATLSLESWEADDDQMSFSAVDSFSGLNETYYGGRYYQNGISLYDLAENVFTDAGVDERDFRIDEYLKSVFVKNPIPTVSHAEALQLIANAGRCILYQDRDGVMFLKSSFSAKRLPDMTASANEQNALSRVENILKAYEKTHYAIANINYATADGSIMFRPESLSGNLNTGFVSLHAANENGEFANENPKIRIDLEAAYKSYGISIQFAGNPPSQILIASYLSGERLESFEFDVETNEFTTSHEFPEFDAIEIEITKGIPGNNVMIDKVIFGNVTDYYLSYSNELTKTPKGTQLHPVKELQMIQTIYAESEEEKELSKENIVVQEDNNRYTFYFSQASYDYRCVDADVSIISSGAYYATIDIFKEPGEYEIAILGKEYIQSQNQINYEINHSGTSETWENPLVSDISHIKELAEWIGDYEYANREYDIDYRGDPRIDVNDIVFLENKNVSNMMIRIYEHSLSFANGGTLSGNIAARRDMYVEPTESRLGTSRSSKSIRL